MRAGNLGREHALDALNAEREALAQNADPFASLGERFDLTEGQIGGALTQHGRRIRFRNKALRLVTTFYKPRPVLFNGGIQQ